jgi:hypothetical protein
MSQRVKHGKLFAILLFAGLSLLSACGGGGTFNPQNRAPLSGNWQFSLHTPTDRSFQGIASPLSICTPGPGEGPPLCSGGFLLQDKGSVTGALAYSITDQNGALCNGGSAPVTGTINGQTVNLTAVAGSQTFTLTGTLSSDGSLSGTYSSTAGTAQGAACGTVQTGLQWTAASVPALTGSVKGSFHSTGGQLGNQNFPVTGVLTQGENIGATNATVTGTLNFVDPASLLSNYPCFDTASVNGQISGNVVILQIIGSNGANIGQIGGVANSGVSTVTFDSTTNGRVLHSTSSPAYAIVKTKACPGVSLSNPGDFGNICLALGGSNVCEQPILLTPANLIFPPQSPLQTPGATLVTQILGSAATTQTITLTNNDPASSTLSGLTLNFRLDTDPLFPGLSDFSGLPNFSEQDTCATSLGTSFSLTPGQSCSITVSFTPQISCPWLPFGSPPSLFGAAPSLCPFPATATLTVNSPTSADMNNTFAVPITGFGASAIQPSTPELDFGAQAVSQSSPAQSLTFTNQSPNPVQILSSTPCVNPPGLGVITLPRPLQNGSPVGGLQVVANGGVANITPNFGLDTITYRCDSDSGTSLPNFQISADTCSGTLLVSQASCSLQLSYAPQPNALSASGLDYFLELNTVQCANGVTSDCEIDSGRFPVELKANPPSPLRMTPAAGLDFGIQPIGDPTFIPAPQTITLFNDPNDPNSATVKFVGKIQLKGSYVELDDCPFSLPPGSSCTITVTFNPKAEGFDPGTLTINYTPEPTGVPQIIYLRGTGHLIVPPGS